MHRLTRDFVRLALAALMLAPPGAQALQLGGLTVDSKLGQPFAGRIELLVGPRDDLAALRAEILPATALTSGGAMPDIGGRLAVRIVPVAGGGAFLSIKGSAPVSEPIAGFRVRVAQGLRGQSSSYTALLDPPVVARPAPRRPVAGRALRPVAPRPATPVQVPVAPAAASATGGTYGPVKSGETLWKIARSLRRDGTVSVQAVVEALHRANPAAFAGGNVDRLKLGAVLVVPADIAGAAASAPAPAVTQALPAAAPVAVESPAVVPVEAPAPAPVRVLPVAPTAAQAEQAEALRAAAEAVVSSGGSAAASEPAPVVVLPVTAAAAPAAPAPAAVAPAVPAPVTPAAPPAAAQDSIPAATGLPGWLLPAGVVLLVAGLAWSGRRLLHRRVRRSADQAHRAAEHARVAALAEKAALWSAEQSSNGKVVRMRRQQAPAPAAPASIDPFAEVDLNLAYGRYGEAEQSLRQVLATAPHNHQARLKLAEVYYTTGRGDAYCALAEELHGEYRGLLSDADWQRVVEMGRVVAPGHPLFGGPTLVGTGQPPRA